MKVKVEITEAVYGGRWYVLELVKIGGDVTRAHRDTSKSKAGARTIAAELRRGARVYDPERGHTVPTKEQTT